MEKIFKVFGKQLPAGTKLHFIDIQSEVLDTVGIVHATYEINYTLDGIENNYYGRRSTVFQWDNDRWHAIHLHVSEPSAHLASGESWPVKALKAQNEELKEQVSIRTEELNKSLNDLKATQQQLIQSEKMASLGELTAGIAHEIQNPLNFVNNFSEVNEELIEELKNEAVKGNLEGVKAIAKDIEFNSEKISHHGKRADAIVKGMLQHSRTSSGQKEPTDINALVDEYLRLAYHGLRAKDKSFNATMKTDLDETIGNINIVPQDIVRVILNLITNAFYTVSEKKKQAGNDYEPTVTVNTKKIIDAIEVKVKDNGNGIPQKILDKIFQPFFTTKPTGQGTGLGLSLSYDIIKAHGGEIKAGSKEGEGAEFIVILPA
jgi:signal transduction histidine kinase